MGLRVCTNVSEACHPLVHLSNTAGTEFDWLCGSSFVIADEGDRTLIATACHVVTNQPEEANEPMALAVDFGAELKLVRVKGWHLRKDVDLAIGWVDWEGLGGLQVAPGLFDRRLDLFSVEHSTSIVPGDRPGEVWIAPLLRKGHLVTAGKRILPSLPEVAMLELSCPAFAGASGAPVILIEPTVVVGVLLANRGRDLAPSQVLTAYGDDGSKVEEIRYFLPSAIAVQARHLLDAIGTAKAAFGDL